MAAVICSLPRDLCEGRVCGIRERCLGGWAISILARVLHVLGVAEVLCEGVLLGRSASGIQAGHLEIERIRKDQEADVMAPSGGLLCG